MKTRYFFLIALSMLAAAAGGCAEPVPIDSAAVLSPGREMRLTFRSEIHMNGGAAMGTSGSSISWADLESSMIVTAIPESTSLRVTMKCDSMRGGGSYIERGEIKFEEEVALKAGQPVGPELEWWGVLSEAKFVAVIDPQRRLVSADAVGEHWADLRKEFAEDIRKEKLSEAEAEMMIWGQTAGVFSALEDAMAYLPPEGLSTGQSWEVRRERVLPYRSFEFGMMTGCAYAKEETTCSALSVKIRGSHSIVTIAIRGKRFPDRPGLYVPARVKYLDLKGQLEFNMNTGAVEKLRLESKPVWSRPKEDGIFKPTFAQTVTLKRT